MPEPNEYPAWAIAQSIKAGKAATEALRDYRDAGGSVRTQSWFRLWGEVENAFGRREGEQAAPLNRRPTAEEIDPWTTVRATGYIQEAEIWFRDHVTGDIDVKRFNVKGDSLRSREAIIAEGISAYSDTAKDYGQTIVGGTYLGTWELDPAWR